MLINLSTTDHYSGYPIEVMDDVSEVINQKDAQVCDVDLGKVIVASPGPAVINIE